MFVELDVTRLRNCAAIVGEKKKLRIADAHPIAMLEQAGLDRHVVDERAVQTLEVSNYKAFVFFFDFRMTPRDRGVGDAKIRLRLTANNHRLFVDGEDCSFEFARHCCETRWHWWNNTRLPDFRI